MPNWRPQARGRGGSGKEAACWRPNSRKNRLRGTAHGWKYGSRRRERQIMDRPAVDRPTMDKPTMDKRTHPIRIVIADRAPSFRAGLRRLLESEQDMKVVGEACDGFEAVKLATDIKPDILLLDLAMPPHTGLEALRDLSTRAGGAGPVRIILLTAAVEKKQVVEALQLGARGVVLKDSATQLLLKSIHAVMAGEYWVGRDSVSNLVQYLRNLMQSTNEETKQKKFGLTPRELEIVSAVVAGYANREIAEYFKISEDTVKHHLSNIFDKLGVSTRLELALFAVNQGLPLKTIV